MDEATRRLPPLTLSGQAVFRHRPPSTVLATALFALAFGGCETAATPDSDTAIRTDSAGVMLVEYSSLPPMEESRIAIASEPDLVLGEGAVFEGPDYDFFRISGVSQLGDGTLVVANGGTRELRFYRQDGRFLRSVGRRGDGPGEFRDMWHHWLMAGDTVVVLDRHARRLQHFGPDGAFVRSTSIVTAPFTAEFSGAFPWPQAVLEDGQVVVFVEPIPAPNPSSVLVAIYRITEGGWDSVRVVTGSEDVYFIRSSARAAGAGATMAVADVARFRVDLFDPDGRLVSILSATVPEIPVTADVIDAQVELDVDWFGGLPSEQIEGRRSYYSARHGRFLPAIRDIFVDADERIWVERYDVPARGPSRWEVFERDGIWIGSVEMPEGLVRSREARTAPQFSVASGRLAGVWRDPDTGVETVRVYRVIELDT
jgi:hypothetical protein